MFQLASDQPVSELNSKMSNFKQYIEQEYPGNPKASQYLNIMTAVPEMMFRMWFNTTIRPYMNNLDIFIDQFALDLDITLRPDVIEKTKRYIQCFAYILDNPKE